MRVTLGLSLLLAALPALGESAAENAFASAREWTVHIKRSLEAAFIEDEQGSWSGSGLVVDPARGWVVTNAHVASRSFAQLSLSFVDSHPLPAARLYVDPYLDLAIITYDPKRLDSTPSQPKLQCRNLPAVGHPVGAFGHPWGFRFTGTRGITSALTSRLGPDMLQTDAPINSGNSGGPLISLETGAVLGINTAKLNQETVEGMGFAVPMPSVCRVLDLLRQGRDPSPPDTLVNFAMDDAGEQTLVVGRSRLPDGALALRPGDEIIAAQGAPVTTPAGLVNALRGSLDSVVLRLRREGAEREVSGRWPAAPRLTERAGLVLAGALFASADRFSHGLIAGSPAIMVHHVATGSAAEGADLEPFDLLLSANGQPVASLEDLKAVAEQSKAAQKPLQLLLIRIADNEELFVYQRRALPTDSIAVVGPQPAAVQVAGVATSLVVLPRR